MDEIRRILYSYSKRQELILGGDRSNWIFQQLVECLLYIYKTYGYIERLIIDETTYKRSRIAEYSLDSHDITMYINRILNGLGYLYKKINNENSFYVYLAMNCRILQSLLHEFGHAIYLKEIKNDKVSTRIFILQVIHYIIDIKYQSNKEVYNDYYRYLTDERLTEIESYKILLEIISAFDDIDTTVLQKIFLGEIYSNYIRGYSVSKNGLIYPPTERVICELDSRETYGKILEMAEFEHLDLRERLELGLPVTRRELQKTISDRNHIASYKNEKDIKNGRNK